LLVFLLPEEDQQNLAEFCIAVAITLATSIGVAIFFVPACYSLLFSRINQQKKLPLKNLRTQATWFKRYTRLITFLNQYKKTVATALVLSFGLPVFLLPAKWDGTKLV
jgi:multidrug efflux pump subunit AcrB